MASGYARAAAAVGAGLAWIATVGLGLAIVASPMARATSTPAPATQTPAHATSAPATSAPTALPSLAAFAHIPFIEEARLSPDGKKLAGLLGVAGERRICVLDLFGESKPHCALIPDGTEPYALRWVNDQNIIVSLQVLQTVGSAFVTGPDRMYVSRLIAMNATTGKLTKILWNLNGQNVTDVLWVAHDGTPFIEVAGQNSILLSEDFWPSIYKVNVETGRYDMIEHARQDIMDWAADSRGVVRAGEVYNDDTRSFRMVYRGETGGGFRTIERANTTKGESLLRPLAFLPGGNHALALHDDDKGHTALYEVDLATGKDVRSLYAVLSPIHGKKCGKINRSCSRSVAQSGRCRWPCGPRKSHRLRDFAWQFGGV